MEAESIDHAHRGRLLVQGAYRDRAGPVGSIAGLFSGKGKGQKESHLKPSRVVSGLSPTRVHATETRAKSGTREPKASGLSNGRVLRAISMLKPRQQLWIHYCYNPSKTGKSDVYRRLFRLSWDDYSHTHMTGRKHSTREVVRALYAYQLERCTSYRSFMIWTADRPAEVAHMNYGDDYGIDGDTWSRKFKPHWCHIRATLIDLNREALERVSHAV